MRKLSLRAVVISILAAAPLAAPRAAEAPESKALLVQKYYDQAFGFYKTGDYGRAIQVWDDILRLDVRDLTTVGSDLRLRATLRSVTAATAFTTTLTAVTTEETT